MNLDYARQVKNRQVDGVKKEAVKAGKRTEGIIMVVEQLPGKTNAGG